jgi:guanylate kinase
MESDESAKQLGKFILVVGPTGSGKSVLIAYVREHFPDLIFPSSYTTREKRPGNENAGYKFLTVDEFEKMQEAGEFIEWAKYGANYYATLKSEVEAELAEGRVMLKEMEVQGVRQIQSLLPKDHLVLIYVDAGSWEEMERRVRARAPISDEELALRKKRYEDEAPFKEIADFVIFNPTGGLEEAEEAIAEAIRSVQASLTNTRS